MEKLEFQNKVLRSAVLGLLLLLALLSVVVGIYISDTGSLRREMLLYAQESIKLEYEKIKDDKEQTLNKGYQEIEQLEKLIDDYKSNSLEMNDLLYGMETEITRIRERS